jgi:uncharacterized protein involved in exopolysaccharide biosynthesis
MNTPLQSAGATSELPGGEPGADLSLWSYLNVLLRRRYIILALAVGGAGLGISIALTTPRQYEASASFVAQEPASSPAVMGQLAGQLDLAGLKPTSSMPQFYADLLRSREILRQLVTTRYVTSGGFAGGLVEYFKIKSADSVEAVANAVERIREVVSTQANRATGMVTFQVRTTMAELSAPVASRLLELLQDYNLERRRSQARAEREFVEERLRQAQRELSAREEALGNFFARNRRYRDAPDLVTESERLQRQVNLRQQLYLTLAQSYEAAKIEEVRNTPVVTVVERPEGFVTPKRRGTLNKGLLGLIVGGTIGLLVAFTREYVTRSRRELSRDFQEFQDLRKELFGGMASRRSQQGSR